jgi:ribosomal-protein-alanine N-acetyltransferase
MRIYFAMQAAPIVCETQRLVLREFTLDDLVPLVAMHSDPEVCRFIGGVRSPEQSRQNLVQWMAAYRRDGVSKWAVVLRETGELVGRCGLTPEHIEDTTEWELGWTFARPFWGKGYATEAAAAAMDYWFRELRKPHVISLIRPGNVASTRVAQRLGMKYNRTVLWNGAKAELHLARNPDF